MNPYLVVGALLLLWLLFRGDKKAAPPTETIIVDTFSPPPPAAVAKAVHGEVLLGDPIVTPADPKASCGPGCYYTTDPTDAEAP